jgi:hypothetical protein
MSVGSRFRVVQPWGVDRWREATMVGEHATIDEAFAAIDTLSQTMVRTGAPSDAIEPIVVDASGKIIMRPSIH